MDEEKKKYEPDEPTKKRMDRLIKYLESGNKKGVNDLASGIFITDEGRCNWDTIKYFETYAGVKIYALERDSFGWLVGGIEYHKKVFSYG